MFSTTTGLPNEAIIQRRLTPARFNVAKDDGFPLRKSADSRLRWKRPCSASALVRVEPIRAGAIHARLHALEGPVSHLDPHPEFNDASRRNEEVVRG